MPALAVSGQVELAYYGLSDVGRVRTTNEDQFLVAEINRTLAAHLCSQGLDELLPKSGRPPIVLLLVADGMGGMAAGEWASRLTARTICTYLLDTAAYWAGGEGEQPARGAETHVHQALQRALEECQDALRADLSTHPQHEGMGTTLTMALVRWPVASVLHVGDSRCYLLREGQLRQVTQDHTVAQQLLEQGIDPRQIPGLGPNFENLLSRAIGTGAEPVTADLFDLPLAVDDTLLFCTDGLTKLVPDADLVSVLLKAADPEAAARDLVAAANAGGGADNISVIVARARAVEHKPVYSEHGTLVLS